MQETWIWCLHWEDPLEEKMATHSTYLSWDIPRIEEPGELQSMELQRGGHNWETKQQIKGHNSGAARWNRCIGQGMGKAFRPFPRTSPFSDFHVFANKEALWILFFWGLREASLQRCDWLNHQPMGLNSIASTPPVPGGGTVLGVVNFWSPGWFP